jgi:hypothetical protein
VIPGTSAITLKADIRLRRNIRRFGPIVLQKAPRPIAKTGNIRIPMAEFLNRNSLLEPYCKKLFFPQRPKIVLQHNRPEADIAN